jgi:hypothetical protein
MNGAPKLQQVAHRLMTQQVGTSRDPDSVASAAVTVYTQLLSNLSPLLGELGSAALLRRSLRLMETAFPCYTEVRRAESDGLLQAVGRVLATADAGGRMGRVGRIADRLLRVAGDLYQ